MDPCARHTLDFLAEVLPRSGASILEVGCGDGQVAAALQEDGYWLTAIDPRPEAIAAARARDVDAHEAGLLDIHGPLHTVVLFTRSLHHIAPLDAALERAASLMKPEGLVVLEELAIEAVDGATAQWFFEREALLIAERAIPPEARDLPADPLERWRALPHEPIHEGRAMRAALAARFEIVEERRGPYLFRMLAERIPQEDTFRDHRIRYLIERETEGIAGGALRAAGMRIVARRRPA